MLRSDPVTVGSPGRGLTGLRDGEGHMGCAAKATWGYAAGETTSESRTRRARSAKTSVLSWYA
jgi:hypothetical protein